LIEIYCIGNNWLKCPAMPSKKKSASCLDVPYFAFSSFPGIYCYCLALSRIHYFCIKKVFGKFPNLEPNFSPIHRGNSRWVALYFFWPFEWDPFGLFDHWRPILENFWIKITTILNIFYSFCCEAYRFCYENYPIERKIKFYIKMEFEKNLINFTNLGRYQKFKSLAILDLFNSRHMSPISRKKYSTTIDFW